MFQREGPVVECTLGQRSSWDADRRRDQYATVGLHVTGLPGMIRNMKVAYRTGATPAVAATLGLAAAAWVVTLRQMHGMDMGVATQLGSFAFFLALWVAMMAAMMLPGLVPAVLRRGRSTGPVRAVVPFVASYLVVWTLVGALLYALYRPHGTTTAGLVVIAAGLYELTRLKQHCRRCCRARTRSG